VSKHFNSAKAVTPMRTVKKKSCRESFIELTA
jgi:hypothetical protein